MPIYLDAASHGLPSDGTMSRILRHLELEREVGPIAAAERLKEEFAAVRDAAALLVGGARSDVGFSSTTMAAWLAIVSRLNIAGKRILIAPHEWGENVALLAHLRGNAGVRIEVLPKLDLTEPDLGPWSERIDGDVGAIFVPMVTSISGHRYPVEQIGKLPRPDGCKLIVDAAQALGQTNIDVSTLGADALVATCRKWLRGPRGTALFWLGPSTLAGVTAEVLEPVDANRSLRLGLAVAIAEARQVTVAGIEQRVRDLTAHAYGRAREVGLDTLTGNPPQTGALCLGIPTALAPGIRGALGDSGLHVKWPDPANEPLAKDGTDHLTAMRIAPHLYNTVSDIDTVFDTIAGAL